MISITKRTMILLMILIGAACVFPSSPEAQNITDERSARSALEVTDGVIKTAHEVVQESRSQKGRLKLEKAVELQDGAWSQFRNRGYSNALRLTMTARQEANEAIGIARLEMRAMERVGRTIEETMERTARVRDMMADAGLRVPAVSKMLDEVRDLIEKAQLNINQYQYQLALKIAESARARIARAEQQVRAARSLKEMTEMRLMQLERLMERARERLDESENGHAARQFRFAETQLTRTRNLLADGRYREARTTAEKCEKTLRALIRRLPPDTAAEPGAMLEEAHRLLRRAEEMLGADAPDQALAMLARAREMLGRADEEIDAGRMLEARRMIAEARRLLRGAIAAAGRTETGEDDAASLIEQVEILRDEVAGLLESCTGAGAAAMYERASDHLDRAAVLFDDGQFDHAAAEARIARNMLNRIKDICAGH